MAKEKKYGQSNLYDEAPMSYEQRMDVTRAQRKNKGSFFDRLMSGSNKVKERAEEKAKSKFDSDVKMARAKSKFQEKANSSNSPAKPKGESKPNTFKSAFSSARKAGKGTFMYQGKSYSTVTKDDINKSPYKTLKEYLNAKKKSK